MLRARIPIVGSAFVLLAAATSVARAQSPAPLPEDQVSVYQEPAHLLLVDGPATLERAARRMPAATNLPVLAGDRVQTTTGRLEIAFPDGTVLDMDRHSEIDLLSDTRVRLIEGALVLRVAADRWATADYEVDAPSGRVVTRGPGVYPVAAVTATRAFAAFERWSDAQARAREADVTSADLRGSLALYAGELNRNGRWATQAPYGEVWYPGVPAGWRPYADGSWDYLAPFGWTWTGQERWAWATMHYGRWELSPAGWFWIPGRQWSPAWVAWARSATNVSWCPLGFDNRPVASLWLSHQRLSPWRAWTVVPRARFDRGRRVGRIALHGRELAGVSGSHFFASAPAPPGGGIDRRGSPGTAARGDAPVYTPRYAPDYAPAYGPREGRPRREHAHELGRSADPDAGGPGTMDLFTTPAAPSRRREAIPRVVVPRVPALPRVVVPRATVPGINPFANGVPAATATPRAMPIAPAATATPHATRVAPAATATPHARPAPSGRKAPHPGSRRPSGGHR